MGDICYRVILQNGGHIAVEIVREDGSTRVVPDFASHREADAWGALMVRHLYTLTTTRSPTRLSGQPEARCSESA